MLLPALLACGLLGGEKTELRFAPAEGTKVRRTITLDHALVVQEMKLITSAGSQSSQDQVAFRAHQVLRTLDEFRKVGEGRPLLLQRRFDEVGWNGSFDFGSSKEDIKAVSPLNGTSVVFTWVPEEKSYGKYYDARESSEEVLLRLDEDLDLRVLLPGHPVETGESWSVPAEGLLSVLAPGGRRDLRFDGKRTRANLMRTLRCGLAGNFEEFFGGESKGECKLHLDSLSEVQGRKLATVGLELEIECKVDQRDLQQFLRTPAELASGYQCKSAPASWKLKGKGTLVWDLGWKRGVSLQLQGDQSMSLEVELAIGKDPPTTQRMTLSGGLSFLWQLDEPAAGPPVPPEKPQGQK